MSLRRIVAVTSMALFVGHGGALEAQQGSRGSVSSTRVTSSRSGNSSSWQGQRASGTRTATQTDSGATSTRQAQTQSGATRTTTREVDAENKEVDKTTTTTTTAWGESATRSREVEGQGGYATIEGSASTSTGRSASGKGVAGRSYYGQPAVAGTVNTKYNGTYNAAAARTPYGGWNTAVAGPYGGRVTTTLPSGYRTSTYYGRPYYTYGGAYYRPYHHGGVHYYYPVPPPDYAYDSSPPPGATILMIAGVKYLMSQDGSYSKQATTSDGKTTYQSVPAPQGASIATLPATRVLVTVGGTTYFLSANAFYRRVMNGAQESFVVVTAPAGVAFVGALPADFEVVQLNTMYFQAGGRFYVPYLAPDGREMYVAVDTPPTPASAAAPSSAPTKTPVPASSAAAPAPPAPVRAVVERLEAPAGTVLLVRLAAEVSSATAQAGNRFQGFLDQDLAANGRMIAPQGAKVYGVVSAVDGGSKMKGRAALSVSLTDLLVGGRVTSIKTQPVSVSGGASSGTKKVVGGAVVGATIGAIAGGGDGAAIGAAVGAGAGGVAASASSIDPAVIPAQTPQAFTLAVPLQVEITSNVAVR